MPSRALVRGLTAAATSIMLGVVGGGGVQAVAQTPAQAPAPSSAAGEPDVVVPAAARWRPPQDALVTAGSDGYLAQDESRTYHWVHEADGSQGAPMPFVPTANNNSVALRISGSTVSLSDYATGTTVPITVPAGQRFVGGFTADSVLTATASTASAPSALHVLRAGADGQVTDQAVPGYPADAPLPAFYGQNAAVTVIGATTGGAAHRYVVDLAHLTLHEIFPGLAFTSSTRVVVGGSRVVAYEPNALTVYSERIDDTTGTVDAVSVPAQITPQQQPWTPVPAGDRIVFVPASTTSGLGWPLLSAPAAGGDPSTVQTVLAHTGGSYAVTPDGSVLVTGGTSATDWAVRRIAEDGTVTTVRPLAPAPAHLYGLSYSAGRLVYGDDSVQGHPLMARDVSSVGTATTVGAPFVLYRNDVFPDTCATGFSCLRLSGQGTGTVDHAESSEDIVEQYVSTSSLQVAEVGADDSTIVDAAGDYAVVDTPSTGKQSIAWFQQAHDGNVAFTRAITAAALWGTTLWVPGTTAGSIRPYSLTARTYGTAVQTDAPCSSFKELQADGRWLYWSCGTTAGIHDLTTGRNIAVPSGPGLLGDGYLVRHDTTAGQLVLTDVHTGTAVTTTLAALPASPLTDDRGVTWSVDKYGGGVAYADAGQNIHVVPLADITRSPLAVLAVDPSITGVSSGGTWSAQINFSRPTSGWTFSVKNAGGHVIATRSGSTGRVGAQLTVSWDTDNNSGTSVYDGPYTWALTARPADLQGPDVTATGSVHVWDGPAAPRDYTDDGAGDLLALTPAGRLDIRPGTPSGGGSVAVASSLGTWSASATYVTIGDMSGDGSNDLLVRNPAGSGTLVRYGGPTSNLPMGPAHTIGAGWNIYNSLVSPGDLNGDGRPDLIGRTPSGDLYFYAGDSGGTFLPRVKIGFGYQIYTLMTGVQDLGFDGYGDLLARDKAGVLWRYEGDGRGGLRARVRIGAGWNVYNALVGVGDLDGDGRNDVVARDTAGDLYRYTGLGTGLFAPRVKIGWGWQMYKTLF